MSILTSILRQRLASRQKTLTLSELKSRCDDAPPARHFLGALQSPNRLSVIAEIKFCSPSEGQLRTGSDVEYIAESYARHGAAALSVLTEQHSFGGTLENLKRAKKSCALPVLRKDFLCDEYDIWESRVAEADAVLLIAKMLSSSQLAELCDLAKFAGLAVLVELHDEEDLDKAHGIAGVAWGVNHRNLDTLAVDLNVSERLFPVLTGVKVAESGLRTKLDFQSMRDLGADAVLIGTFLMKSPDPGLALAELLS